MLTLELLKKELAVAMLQQKLGKEVYTYVHNLCCVCVCLCVDYFSGAGSCVCRASV